jgi:large subunit ribosomal protein L15
MKLNTLVKYKKPTRRLGRGIAAGQGKTAGRGHKGQKARTGKKLRPGFEGGQTPLFQRLPKYRGFKNPNRVEFQVVNVGDLEQFDGAVTKETLLKTKLIAKKNLPVKLLGNGELSKSLKVELDKASQSAIDKISKSGGSFTSTMKTEEESPKS